MAALLEVKELSAGYGSTPVLHGVALEVAEGGITTVLGANGAGKTTLLRALCGMIKAVGQIRLHGKAISGRATEDIVRLGVAHVPDGRGTFLDLTTEENLKLGAYTRKDRKAVAEDFERVFAYFPRLRSGVIAGRHLVGRGAADARIRARSCCAPAVVAGRAFLQPAPLVVQDIFRIMRRINQEDGVSMLLVEQNAASRWTCRSCLPAETGRVVVSGPSSVIRNDEAVRRSAGVLN
jgi:branched-chain amino acid transport system ATP-binding protein